MGMHRKRGRERVYLPPLKDADRKRLKRHLKRRMRGKFLTLLAAFLAPSLISAILPR